MDFKEKLKRKTFNAIGLVVNRLAQNEAKDSGDLPKTITPGMPELLREAAAEGTVLLRNDNILPLNKEKRISVFGRVQYDYMYVGYGSGGDVIKPYTVNILEGLENAGLPYNKKLADKYINWCTENKPDHGFWGKWPHYYEEMPITDAEIADAAKESDCGIVVIGRSAGEDRENLLTKGSYYLTDEEKSLILRVNKAFRETVIILNIGSIIDMSWEAELLHKPSAILIPWQGGMESGNAVADVLCGNTEPSGRLTDTIACNYESYPSSKDFGEREYNNYTEDIYVGYRYFETFKKDDVLYPFGFGLGYGSFERKLLEASVGTDSLTLVIETKNTSKMQSKDVLQIYASQPQGVLGKPAHILCDFEKTEKLSPEETQTLTFEIPFYSLASYDSEGKTGNPSSYVLEAGEYTILVGTNARDTEKVFSFTINETKVLQKLSQNSAPLSPFKVLTPRITDDVISPVYEDVHLSKENMKEKILSGLPADYGYIGDCGYTLSDVKEGKITLEAFISQLSPTELEAISRGDYTMDSSLGNPGNAGAMGGVTESLRKKGVSPLITTDGPSGIRIKAYCSLLPIGVSLASTWNKNLAYNVYEKVGKEMKEKGSDILLAPGMNIHRNPLCGRNFEYYSEDPLLTGKIAAAVVKGVQSNGVAACPKHFACNNQETNRNKTDSRLSERALREIYLKGFEICVREASPLTIMTSYNKINGVWGHYNYNLCTEILRREWGFGGLVMTDWWMQYTESPEFPQLKDNAYRVRAGVDVLMPGGKRTGKKKPDGTLLKTYGKPDGITLGELQQTAARVIKVVMAIK